MIKLYNSKHSYERLNWEKLIFSPILVLEDIISEVVDNETNIEITQGARASWSPTPVKAPKCGYDKNIPLLVIEFHKKMIDVIGQKHLTSFLTLTVPPTYKIQALRNKRMIKTDYGLLKQREQIIYLASKLKLWCCENNIKNYIIVYEQTFKGIIHAHILYDDIDEYNKDLSNIMGYKTYNQSTINIVEKPINDLFNTINYICKLHTEGNEGHT